MPLSNMPQYKAGLFGTSGGGGGPRLGPKTENPTLPPPKKPKGLGIEHRIGIQAPAEVVWEVLSDLPRWEAWNPLYPKAAGEIRIGGTLELTLAIPGQAPQQIRPTVLEWVPNEQLHWRLTMAGGLVKTTRFLEIENLAPANCIVSNGEIIGGLLGPRLGKRLARPIYRGFVAMNEALKARAEEMWAARRDS
jgi:hypothetical protein